MRILFVFRKVEYEPLGIMHLSSVLKQAGHEVDLVIATREDPVKHAEEYKPNVMAYSVYTGGQSYYLDLNRRIRARLPGVFSVFGGPHATFFPEMIQEEGVDGVCVGEGELAFRDLADTLQHGGDLTHLENWQIKLDGRIHQNPVRPLIADLDSLPLPDRELLYARDEMSALAKFRPFMASRGCPYDCTFCFNHAFHALYDGKGARIRRRSVDNVLAEYIRLKVTRPVESVIFVDDTFNLDLDWLEEFAEKYPRAGGVPFTCQLRANLVTPRTVKLIKQAGCVSVAMGVETGSDRLRNEVLMRNMTREQLVEAASLLHESGLRLLTTTMLGLPTGTLQDDWESLQLNQQLKPDYASSHIYQPYPRTNLGDLAVSEGLFDGNTDAIDHSAIHSTVMHSGASKRQVENLEYLFAWGVEFPILTPLLHHMVNWPFKRFYWVFYKLLKGYTLKQRIHPHKLTLKEYWQTLRRFWQIDTH